jgi:hypothetical protein
MVLDVHGRERYLRRVFIADCRQLVEHACSSAPTAEVLYGGCQALERIASDVTDLGRPVGTRIPGQGNMRDVAQPQAGVIEQPADRVRREAG